MGRSRGSWKERAWQPGASMYSTTRSGEAHLCSGQLGVLGSNPWRIVRKLRQRRVHAVPRLGARDKNVHDGRVLPGVIQTAHAHANDLGHARETAEQWRPTSSTEATTHAVSRVPPHGMKSGFALGDRKRGGWHPQDGGKGSPTGLLTITAMALEGQQGGGCTDIANRPARTPTGQRSWPGSSPPAEEVRCLIQLPPQICPKPVAANGAVLHFGHCPSSRWSRCDRQGSVDGCCYRHR
jgi:hypothetical protein